MTIAPLSCYYMRWKDVIGGGMEREHIEAPSNCLKKLSRLSLWLMKTSEIGEGKMRKFIAILFIVCLCLSRIGFCGWTPVLTVEAYGGENQDIYGYANIQLRGLQAGQKWNLTDMYPDGVEIRAENDQDLLLGTLNAADITIIEDPSVTLGFSVTAGATATAFSFKSPVLSFDPITNPDAYASGSVSVGEGDTIWGGFWDNPDWDIFHAIYNTDGDGNGGTTFEYFVPDTVGWEFVSTRTINDTVSNIHLKSSFILNAGGIASGTSVFTVEVPEPATVCLLGLGSLLFRRKRH